MGKSKMKNLTLRDKQIFCLLLGLLLVSAVWVFIVHPLEEKADSLRNSITFLQGEYEERTRVREEKEEVIYETEMYNQAFSDLKEHYPDQVEKEDQIALAVELEEALGLEISSVQYDEPKDIYGLISCGHTYRLTENPMTISAICSYAEWKQIFSYLSSRKDLCSISSLSASFDPESGITEFWMTIAQYAIEERKEGPEDGREP